MAVILSLLLACGSPLAPVRAADPDEAPKQAAAKDQKPDNPLHLTEEKRKAAGIVLAKPMSVTLAPEIEAFGRVLDPAPLVSLLAEDATARASLAASEKELARVRTLFENGANASAQAVEAAAAAAAKDRAAADSARLRLIASWGRDFSEPARAAELRQAMLEGARLARVDVLPGDEVATPLKAVTVRLAGDAASTEAAVLGAAPVVDPQIQGRGLLVVIAQGDFPVGAAVRATLPGKGQARPAFVVPTSAIVYHQGRAWVYVLGEKDTFERKSVTIARTVPSGVALADGVEADEQVVTTGAESLLAVELQGAGSED